MKKLKNLLLIFVIIMTGCSREVKSNVNDDNVYLNNIIDSGYMTVYKNNKAGLINEKGKTIIDFEYDYCSYIPVNKAMIACKDAVIDAVGNIENGNWGVVDLKGNILVDFIYDGIYLMNKNQYLVFEGEKCGIVDKNGNVIIDSIYDNIFLSGTNLCVQKEAIVVGERATEQPSGYYGLFDTAGKELLPCEYTWLEAVNGSENQYITKKDNKYGIIGEDKTIILDFVYDNLETVRKTKNLIVSEYIKDLIIAEKNGNMGVIDITGNEIIPFIYDAPSSENSSKGIVYNEESNVFEVAQNNEYGVIRLNGKVIIACQYTSVYTTKSGILAIDYDKNDRQNSAMSYYFDMEGEGIISLKAYGFMPFDEKGISIVQKQSGSAMINMAGKEVASFDKIYRSGVPGLYVVKIVEGNQNKIGVIDEMNNYIIEPTGDKAFSIFCLESIVGMTENYYKTQFKDIDPLILIIERTNSEQIGKMTCYDSKGKQVNTINANALSNEGKRYYSTGMLIDTDFGTLRETFKKNVLDGNNYIAQYLDSETDGMVYGILSYDGKVLIEPKYISITEFDDYYMCLNKHGDTLIDKNTGKIKLTLEEGVSFVRDYDVIINNMRNSYTDTDINWAKQK